jgi:hypothetical protein
VSGWDAPLPTGPKDALRSSSPVHFGHGCPLSHVLVQGFWRQMTELTLGHNELSTGYRCHSSRAGAALPRYGGYPEDRRQTAPECPIRRGRRTRQEDVVGLDRGDLPDDPG